MEAGLTHNFDSALFSNILRIVIFLRISLMTKIRSFSDVIARLKKW